MRADQVTVQLTVGQLATRTGVRADTVWYYEREGLLPVPQRTGGEHRRYRPADVDRLLFIRGAQRLGLRLFIGPARGKALGVWSAPDRRWASSSAAS